MNDPGFDWELNWGENYLYEIKMKKLRTEPEVEEGDWKNWYEL